MQKNVSSTHILRSNCPVAIERHVKRHVEIFLLVTLLLEFLQLDSIRQFY